ITNFIKESETNKELLEKYDEMVYFLESLFFTSETYLRIKDAYKIFLQNLASVKLDDINSGKITVMGLLETRAINFDAVIICDFNEEFIPKISIKDKFLSSKIKKLASLPTTKDRENLQRYYYKRLVENSKEVFISYVNSKDSSISRFAYELFDYKQDKLFDTEYKDILYTNIKLEHSNENIVQNIDLKQFTWSASALKSYLECKRKWYLNYILKIKEHVISNLPKSFELGNIVHKILEEYYKSSNTNIDDLFTKYRANNPFLTLDLEIYKQKVKSFIEFDKKRLENREIVEIEKSFVVDFNDFKITGVIDRVDRYKDCYEVIDYKTSRNLKVDTEKNYEKSSDFQLEFYFLAIKTLYKPQQIRAFYYDIYENLLKEEIVLEPKLELLKAIFDDFKNQSKSQIEFCKTEDSSKCEFCPYKTICNKD
ncbi:PD-(D/E)XK nuclease family protein, partial [Aliarcobacter skirrowii]